MAEKEYLEAAETVTKLHNISKIEKLNIQDKNSKIECGEEFLKKNVK